MTHPLAHLTAAVGQVPASAIDAPADAGPEARAQILRLQLRIGKLEARLAQANEQVQALAEQANSTTLAPPPGLTLRDYFAAQAMPSAMEWNDYIESSAARFAYVMADAMLKAREVKP